MYLQYISDSKGQKTGVIIPIKDWEALKSKYKGLEEDIIEQSKEEVLQGLKQAVEEMNLVKAGKIKARSAKDLIDEL